jgi:CheY-like chemotaxis protein
MVSPSLPWHILATDDDPAICALLDELLTDEGYRVSLSASHDVAEVARLGPDLILLDYWNSSLSTPSAFLDWLKAEPMTTAIPIVILTGARQLAEIQAAHFATLDVTVVLKPFAIDDLLAEIAGRLNGAQAALYAAPDARSASGNRSPTIVLKS